LTTVNAAISFFRVFGERRRLPVFKVNVGSTDRIIRIVIGLVLITLVFVGPKTAWGWIGLIPLATGVLRTCPAYSMIGVNTSKSK
jgi:hypothetical protein